MKNKRPAILAGLFYDGYKKGPLSGSLLKHYSARKSRFTADATQAAG